MTHESLPNRFNSTWASKMLPVRIPCATHIQHSILHYAMPTATHAYLVNSILPYVSALNMHLWHTTKRDGMQRVDKKKLLPPPRWQEYQMNRNKTEERKKSVELNWNKIYNNN